MEPRPPGQSAIDNEPEMPFTQEWGSLVRRARHTAKLSQGDLAEAVGVEQPVISQIENHTIKSSKAVMPIVRVLKIPPPAGYFEDELEQRWVESGRVLRRRNEAGFRGLLAAAEQMIATAGETEH